MQRKREPIDAVIVLEIEGDERCRAAERLDGVVELFEPADGARNGDDVRAGSGKRKRSCIANAAGGAGDERNPIREGRGIRPC